MLVPAVFPNLIALISQLLVPPKKSVPVSVTTVPPPVGPRLVLMLVTVGAVTKVKLSEALVADVPPSVVTVTSTRPAAWAGLVMSTVVFVQLARPVPAVAANFTPLGGVWQGPGPPPNTP